MKKIIIITLIVLSSILLTSCFDDSKEKGEAEVIEDLNIFDN